MAPSESVWLDPSWLDAESLVNVFEILLRRRERLWHELAGTEDKEQARIVYEETSLACEALREVLERAIEP